jgi:uncharacterized ion transporter superfamily protein YfcC
MKNKKPLFITLIALDVALTLFLLVVSIILLASTAGKNSAELEPESTFIGYLQHNPNVFGFAFVIPLFLLLTANIVCLVVYVRKTTKKEPVKVNDLTDEQKEALRKELLKDLQGNSETKE